MQEGKNDINQLLTLIWKSECSVKHKNDVETSWPNKGAALSCDLRRFILLWYRQIILYIGLLKIISDESSSIL